MFTLFRRLWFLSLVFPFSYFATGGSEGGGAGGVGVEEKVDGGPQYTSRVPGTMVPTVYFFCAEYYRRQ